jgi:hypothetical protein
MAKMRSTGEALEISVESRTKRLKIHNPKIKIAIIIPQFEN